MKIFLLALITATVVSNNAQTAFTQQRQTSPTTIRELKTRSVAMVAPRECLASFRELFSYLQKADANIVRDETAQKRWLTQELRKSLAQKVTTFTSPADDPDFPSNATFVGSWDYPTTYSIVASRRYGPRAVIDVLYKWGPKTNYPGDERTTSFVFLYEDGTWKLDDIYTFRGAYVQAESLSQYLREK
ncbi:MAG TPA: hypothetical protein VN844_12475 [Pyrinomonadaceae bacterium]|nr:hypothetical protein [Pyrinomonadaceae bacterium]